MSFALRGASAANIASFQVSRAVEQVTPGESLGQAALFGPLAGFATAHFVR